MNEALIVEKKALRKIMLEKRAALDPVIKSVLDSKYCELLFQKIVELNAKTVHCYLPMGQEVNLYPLIKTLLESGIRVVCPKTLPNRQLENRILKSLDDLEAGPMGTKHPAGKEVYDGDYDLIVVPGLAFDKEYYRLGYGGGYYDNFLAEQPKALKIGVFYPFQRVDKVPKEAHDVRFDELIF